MSPTYTTYSEMLDDYIMNTPIKTGAWQRYKNDVLHYRYGRKAYPGERERWYELDKKHRNRAQKKMLRRMMLEDNPLLKLLEKDRWEGSIFFTYSTTL